MAENELKMTFQPNIIEDLGIRMYKNLPNVLAELVANSYDADASRVKIVLSDDKDSKEIVVKDNGTGMLFDEINEKFLLIGRKRRLEGQLTPGGRKIIGKKGLGKLAFFGIANEIEIETRKNKKKSVFSMSWHDIASCSSGEYKPKVVSHDDKATSASGTDIKLRDIKRVTKFDANNVATSLSRVFHEVPGFEIVIEHNSEPPVFVKRRLRYSGLKKEIEWSFPEESGRIEHDYDMKNQIRGTIIATEKPISNTEMRGISLFSRNKLVNEPEYFSPGSESSHFYSYITGDLDVDFIDDSSDDVILTDRRHLDWGHPEIHPLREYLREMISQLQKDWRKKRKARRKKELEKELALESYLKEIPPRMSSLAETVFDLLHEEKFPGDKLKKIHSSFREAFPPKITGLVVRDIEQPIIKFAVVYYLKGDYYQAVLEGVKEYVNELEKICRKENINKVVELELIKLAFGGEKDGKPLLSVVGGRKKPDGGQFNDITRKNLEDGYHNLAKGVWKGSRCLIAHEKIGDLENSGLYTKEDCLDTLSLISYLHRSLKKSRKNNTPGQNQ